MLAPGWEPLAFPPPEPGTYDLPTLGDAADGEVRDATGHARRLHELMRDKIVVLSFIYRSCPDPNGCPLANYVLSGVEKRIRDTPALQGRVRLLSLSFDPARDGPDEIRELGAHLARGGDWQFLTTDSTRELDPILRGYGQSVATERNGDGAPTGVLTHVLRVFLIDRDQRIRNIYSSSFLHADTVISDIETLLREDARPHESSPPLPTPATGATQEGAPSSIRPGGRSWPRGRRLTPLGLPPVPVPADNPLTPEKIALGRKLFFDRRLSRNDTMSCAMCHIPEQGFTSNAMATAVGIEGRTVRRNAPSIYNAAYAQHLFVDARASTLEAQPWEPLLAPNEMGNASVAAVVAKVVGLKDYRGPFEAAFARGPSKETLAMALASYERTVISGDSAFDRWFFAGQSDAIPPEAQRGFDLFTGAAGCARCHTIDRDHPLFTDQAMHNTGVGYRQMMARSSAPRRLQLAPNTFIDFDPRVIADATETPPDDLGRYEITHDPADRWKYRTPMLRNVALTAPYMHDGSVATLRDVVALYDAGGVPHALLDPALHPLHLSESDTTDLVAFLESLTGNDVNAIVADALSSPIGDPH